VHRPLQKSSPLRRRVPNMTLTVVVGSSGSGMSMVHVYAVFVCCIRVFFRTSSCFVLSIDPPPGKTTFLNDTTKSHRCTYIRQFHKLRPYITVRTIPHFDPTKLPYWDIYVTENVASTIKVGGTLAGEFTGSCVSIITVGRGWICASPWLFYHDQLV
jgi:hypothetical protein